MRCWRREDDAPNKEILTMVRRVWLASGPICPSDSLPSDLPLQPSYAGEPEHIPLRESNGWTRFKVKLSQPLVHLEGSEFALASQPPTASMTRVAFQHFLTRSERRSFNTCLVSFEFIEFLNFDFHIVIEIRMRSLSECLLWSFSKEQSRCTSGQFLGVDLRHILYS